MHHRHYGLQALLYTVALHRYLRWRRARRRASPASATCSCAAMDGTPGRRRVRLDAARRARGGGQRCPRRLTVLDARRALGATGLLAEFNAAGVITAADVHVARRLCDRARGGRRRRPPRHGARRALAAPRPRPRRPRHIRTRPPEPDETRSPSTSRRCRGPRTTGRRVATQPHGLRRAARLEGSPLYLDRYWREESAGRRGPAGARRAAGRGRGTLADGLGAAVRRRRRDGRQALAARPRSATAWPSSPAAPAPARPPPSPASWRCCSSRTATRWSPSPRRRPRRRRGCRRRSPSAAPDLDVTADVRARILGLRSLDPAPPARLAARQPQPLPPPPRPAAAARRRHRRRDLDGVAVA